MLTKADKISVPALSHLERDTITALASEPAAFPELIVTSSERNIGLDRLRAAIARLIIEG